MAQKKQNSNEFLAHQLRRPTGMVDVVLDTDAFNEIDDQFAISYLLHTHDRLQTKALYAAPFYNIHSASPEDGMEKSYDEIRKVLTLCEREDLHPAVYKGSRRYLPDENTPVISPAAEDLAARAMTYTPENPLYVLAIGAITNVASALLINPDIIDRIVVVWLGGQAHHFPNWREFNLAQDIAAGRVIFNSTVPFVQMPCMSVVSHLTTTEPELRHHLKGKTKIGDYLYHVTCEEAKHAGPAWSRVIWDIASVAWMLGEAFVLDSLVPAPIPTYENSYIPGVGRHLISYVYWVQRDAIFADLFAKLGSVSR